MASRRFFDPRTASLCVLCALATLGGSAHSRPNVALAGAQVTAQYIIRNVATGKCIDIANGSTDPAGLSMPWRAKSALGHHPVAPLSRAEASAALMEGVGGVIGV